MLRVLTFFDGTERGTAGIGFIVAIKPFNSLLGAKFVRHTRKRWEGQIQIL